MVTTYIENISFPIRFTSNCDVELSNNEETLKDNINVTLFVNENGIPLIPLGLGLDKFVFDPNDDVLKDYLEIRIRDSINDDVAGVSVREDMVSINDENTFRIFVHYLNEYITKDETLIIPTDKVIE
jgi:hypothetical protein